MRLHVTAAILATASLTLLAQSAPVKMGLWEKTMVTSIGSGSPETMTAQSCITPEAWQRMTANIQKQHDGCTMNVVKTANSYSFSGTCSAGKGPAQISGSETIKDSEHIVAESHSVMTMNGVTRKLDTRSTSRFLSANCGSVAPE